MMLQSSPSVGGSLTATKVAHLEVSKKHHCTRAFIVECTTVIVTNRDKIMPKRDNHSARGPRTCHKLSVRCWKTVKFVAWHACIAGCIVRGLARFGCSILLPCFNTLASKPSSVRAPHERAGVCSRVPEPGLQEGASPKLRYLSHVLLFAAPMRR